MMGKIIIGGLLGLGAEIIEQSIDARNERKTFSWNKVMLGASLGLAADIIGQVITRERQ